MKLQDMMRNALEQLAENIPAKAGSTLNWGDVEMPACVKQELEEESK